MKLNKQIFEFMKPSKTLLAVVMVTAVGLLSATAQPFQSGSDGTFGAINVTTTDLTLDLPPDGVIHATTVNVGLGRILRFRHNALKTPPVILATGDVTIAGEIRVTGGQGSASAPGLAGPGGFDGGAPGSVGLPAGDGLGPGGGKAGTTVADETAPGNGSYATTSSQGPVAKRGATYGSALLFPMVGGSGGGGAAGNPGFGGGGGGGAVLIASSTKITVSGRIGANGGNGMSSAILNHGSGGAIRLVAPIVTGTGTLDVRGDNGGAASGMGRIRIDTLDRTGINLTYLPANTTSVGGFMVVFPNPVPRLDIVEAAGRTIAVDAGPTQVLLPSGSPATQVIKVRARDFAQVVPIRVVITPDNGPSQNYDTEINNTAVNPAEGSVTVSIPPNVLTHVHVWTR